MAAQVADNVLDAQLSSIIASLSREDFIKYVSKPVSINTFGMRVKMSVLYLFYTVYAQWAHQDGQPPLYQLALVAGKSCVEDCPLKVDELPKAVTAAIKDLNIEPPLAISGGGAVRSHNHGMPGCADMPGKPNSLLPEANMPNWQRLLVPPSNSAASADRLQRILDDVQYLSESITWTAAKSLKELFVSHGVESNLANALAAVRTAARPHAAVRQVTSGVATGLKQQLLAPLEEWVGMCMKLAPSGLSTSDQNSFVEEARDVLNGAKPETD